jgi:hypothetical protein
MTEIPDPGHGRMPVLEAVREEPARDAPISSS